MSSRSSRLSQPAAAAVAVTGALIAVTGCASALAVNWPAALQPAAGESWLMTLVARGVQIYECRGNGSAAAWAFVAPEAIRRLHTVGGMAPAAGCGPATLGATVRVPYAADYFLYGSAAPRAAGPVFLACFPRAWPDDDCRPGRLC